jgi:hypothetical protein
MFASVSHPEEPPELKWRHPKATAFVTAWGSIAKQIPHLVKCKCGQKPCALTSAVEGKPLPVRVPRTHTWFHHPYAGVVGSRTSAPACALTAAIYALRHICAHTHSHTHTYTHALHSWFLAHMCTCTHTFTRALALVDAHPHTHLYSHVNTCAHIYPRGRSYTCAHTHTQTPINPPKKHTRMHLHAHVPTHTYAQTCTHVHTHTHTIHALARAYI